MPQLWFVLHMVVAGVLIAFQSPINAALARSVGVFQATVVSFTVGLVLAALVAGVTGGTGGLKNLATMPWWQWLGGALGAIYVTSIIVSVPRIGVTTAMIAALAGQMVAALVIDHFGWFGVTPRPVELRRILALPLLGAALWLVQKR